MWSRKKWILRCKLQGATMGHLETDCENVFRTSKHWRKKSNLWEFAKMRLHWNVLQNYSRRRWWFWRPNLSLQRIHTSSRRSKFQDLCNNSRTNYNWTSSSSSYYTISWHQRNWNSDSFHNKERFKILGGDLPSHVEELRLNDPDHNPTSSELLLERYVAKESEPCSTELEQSRIRETHATQFEIPTNPVYCSKEVILVGKGKWNNIPAYKHFRGRTFEAEVSNLVIRLLRRSDQNERETDGAVHWNSMGPKLRRAFQKVGGQNFSDSDRLPYFC